MYKYKKYVVGAREEQGYTVPSPYKREIQHIFAPDKRQVKELTFSRCVISPGSRTSKHEHDRGELIYIVNGQGKFIMDDEIYPIASDMSLWVPKEVTHQLINTGDKSIKIVTVFVPAYESEKLRESILSPE